jgi:excisionase family DNA binding protein
MLTSTELGKALGMAKSTVLKLANVGKIPALKINDRGDYRFDLAEVKEALRVKPGENK